MSKSVKEFKSCNICGGTSVRKTSNAEIYGKEYGNGMCFLCDDCKSYVGCHPNGKSLGILSNHEMREKKKQCHALFDPTWRELRAVKRSELYRILAERMGIKTRDCHFGYFDIEELDKAIEVMSKKYWFVEKGV